MRGSKPVLSSKSEIVHGTQAAQHPFEAGKRAEARGGFARIALPAADKADGALNGCEQRVMRRYESET